MSSQIPVEFWCFSTHQSTFQCTMYTSFYRVLLLIKGCEINITILFAVALHLGKRSGLMEDCRCAWHILPTLSSRWLILCTDEAMTSIQEQGVEQASRNPVIVWNIHKDPCKTIVCLDSYHSNRSCCRLFSLPYIWIVCQWSCLVTIKQAPFLYYRGDTKMVPWILGLFAHISYNGTCCIPQ